MKQPPNSGPSRRNFLKGNAAASLAFTAGVSVGYGILATSNADDARKRADSSHAATIYDGPMGNAIFNAATIWYAQGLSSPPGHVLPANRAKPQGPDPRVQRMTANLFDRFIK